MRKYRLRWAGHVRRMNTDRIPKRILFGELADGKRGKSRPKKNWIACLEDEWDRLRIKKKDLDQPFSKWTKVAKQRPNLVPNSPIREKKDLYYYYYYYYRYLDFLLSSLSSPSSWIKEQLYGLIEREVSESLKGNYFLGLPQPDLTLGEHCIGYNL